MIELRILILAACAALAMTSVQTNAQSLPDKSWSRAYASERECSAALKREVENRAPLGSGRVICSNLAQQWYTATRAQDGGEIAKLHAPFVEARLLVRAGRHYLRVQPGVDRQSIDYRRERAMGCAIMQDVYKKVMMPGPAVPYSQKGGGFTSSTQYTLERYLPVCGKSGKAMHARMMTASFNDALAAIQTRCTRADQSDPAIVGVCAEAILAIDELEKQQPPISTLDRNEFIVAKLIVMGTLVKRVFEFRGEASGCQGVAAIKGGVAEVSLPVSTFHQMMVPISIKRHTELSKRCA